MSIWDNIKRDEDIDIEKELSEEIKGIREKQKIFQATNESDTYLVLVFSCKADKDTFLQNLHLKRQEHTYLDGYEVARNFEIEPKLPTLKLPKPLNK